jgi:hypothetical protein
MSYIGQFPYDDPQRLPTVTVTAPGDEYVPRVQVTERPLLEISAVPYAVAPSGIPWWVYPVVLVAALLLVSGKGRGRQDW